jgi:hypothetical protein
VRTDAVLEEMLGSVKPRARSGADVRWGLRLLRRAGSPRHRRAATSSSTRSFSAARVARGGLAALFAGRLRAERRTKKSGSGIEFADHREYTPATTSAPSTGTSTPAPAACPHQALRRGRRPRDLRAPRLLGLDGLGRALQVRPRAAARGGDGLRGPRQPRPRRHDRLEHGRLAPHAPRARQEPHLQGLRLPPRRAPRGRDRPRRRRARLRRGEQAPRRRRHHRVRPLRPRGLRARHQRHPLPEVRAHGDPRHRRPPRPTRARAATSPWWTSRRATRAT